MLVVIWTNPTLQSNRALLRPLGIQDTDALWEDLQDPEARRLTGTHRAFAYEDIAVYCASRADQTDRLTLAITEPSDATYRGEIVLNDQDEANRSAGLRIALSQSARGQGLGTEALRLLLAHAFDALELHRVSLEVFAFNARAIHVYEKIGFRHEGRMRDALWWDSMPYDTLLMAILESDRRS